MLDFPTRVIQNCKIHLTFKSADKKKSLEELGLARKSLVTVGSNWKTIQAIMHMNQSTKSPLLSAVPVIDSRGKLVATFSGSNLRVILNNSLKS